jgi:inner membrane protein
MPTIISHAAVPLALGFGFGVHLISRRLQLAGVAASMAPDLDVAGFHWHIAYADAFGHRGASHSLAFAVMLGLLAVTFAPNLKAGRKAAFLFVACSAASHGLLDMLTNGGLGVAVLWPFSAERFFFPWQPITVAPFGLRVLSDVRGLAIFCSEFLWVWLPAATCALILRLMCIRFRSGIDAIE